MTATRAASRVSAAEKYDVLTLLGVVGLSGGPSDERSMLRLIALVTARYNWVTGEISVGRREIAKLWAVDERTVKREMARLKGRGFVVLKRAGVRGRVSTYALDLAAIRAACDWMRVGPDFAERMAAASGATSGAAQPERQVIPFPGAAAAAHAALEPGDDGLSEWSAARRALRSLGQAAFDRWIAPLRRAGRSGGRLRLEAPSAFHADYVERTYIDAIRVALRTVDAGVESVRVAAQGDTVSGDTVSGHPGGRTP